MIVFYLEINFFNFLVWCVGCNNNYVYVRKNDYIKESESKCFLLFFFYK